MKKRPTSGRCSAPTSGVCVMVRWIVSSCPGTSGTRPVYALYRPTAAVTTAAPSASVEGGRGVALND